MSPSNRQSDDRIGKYYKKLERRVRKLKKKQEKIQHYMRKHDELPITVANLEQTINNLERYGNKVTEASNDLVAKWKEMVVQKSQSEQGTSEDKTAKPHDSPKNEPASPAAPVIENIIMLPNGGNYEYQNGDELNFHDTDGYFEDENEIDSGNESEPYQELRLTENASNEGSAFDSHEEPSSSRKRKREYNDAGSDPGGKRLKGSDSSRSDRQDVSATKHNSRSDRRTSKDDKITESSSSEKTIKTKGKSKSSKVSTQKRALIESVDSGSGASFAEALGMCVPVIGKTNKKTTPIRDRPLIHADKASSSSEKPSSNLSMPSLLKEPPPSMDPPDKNIANLIAPITPNYRQLGITTLDNFQTKLTDDEALGRLIMTKNQRTKVYSGNKTVWTKVPTLFDLCTRVLPYSLDGLKYTGGVPTDILKPILERATCLQLYTLERHNPYIIDDCDELWKLYCMKDFETKKPEELESWRNMYMRCMEAKFRALIANIKQSQAKPLPVRTTKLEHVDDYVKPPRNVLRQQARHSTAHAERPTITPAVRAATASSSKGSVAEGKVVVPNPGPRATEKSSQAQRKVKPKKAPLMARALSDMKKLFRR